MSIDAAELEGLSADELRKKYDAHARGNAGVQGTSEDLSDVMAKGMQQKRQKMEKEKERKGKGKDKDFKF